MTEEIAATPGWVEERLEEVFAGLSDATRQARDAYVACLARAKTPGAPSDLLGAEFDRCRAKLHLALLAAGVDHGTLDRLTPRLEALEAELTAES